MLVVEFELNVRESCSFVNKEIGVLVFSSPLFASETFGFNIARIKLTDTLIVELNPFGVIFTNIAEVVSEIRTAIMNNNPTKTELKLPRLWLYTLLFG